MPPAVAAPHAFGSSRQRVPFTAVRSVIQLSVNQIGTNMVTISKSPVREGLPHPRGATWYGKGVNFALFSAHATRVELCLFDETGETRIDLPEYTDEIWHG